MRYCSVCGAPLPEENAKFCPNCGRDFQEASAPAATSARPAGTPLNPALQIKKRSPELAPAGLDKATFFKRYSQGRQACVSAAVLGYISAGVTLLLAVTNYLEIINIYSVIDVLLLLALCLLIHILRSRVASVLLLSYALFNTAVMLINYGNFVGWLGIVAGVSAVIGSFQCVKEWKSYQERTQSPEAVS